FELSRDVDEAGNDVRDRVSRIKGRLPREADDPIVAKVDVNAQPIYWLALSSDRHSLLQLSETAELVLKERIQRLPGVGSVFIGGQRRYAMRVWLDPLRMAAHGVTTVDVENAIRLANAEIPGGRVEGERREFAVRTRGELTAPSEFADIIISQTDNNLVRISDVAEVEVGAEDDRTIARYNGINAVGLGIVKQSRASTVAVADVVTNSIPELSEILPPGMTLQTAYNSAVFIEDSISEVAETIFIAMVLVILVVLAFLKSFRATLIPAVAIPISIVGTFAMTYFMGFTINILTLLALVLAIGLVVDDAIVMLENVYRHMEMGKSRWQAAIEGAKEIGFAIVATTIALVAVFVPVAFLTGNVGRLFNEFGMTVAVAVAISGFVALTLTPMLCSKMLKPLHGVGENWAGRSFDAFFEWLARTYDATLQRVLRWKWAMIVGAIILIAVSVVLFQRLPNELAPTEDRSIAFGFVLAPEGSTLQYMDRYMREIESILMPLEERAGLFTAAGLGFGGPGQVTNGFIFLRLKPRSERDRSQQEIVGSLFPRLISIPGVLAFLINPASLGGRFGSKPVEYVLQGDNYPELNQAVGQMMGRANELGYLVNMDTDLRLNKPQLDITIDRNRAAGLGVSVTDIGSTLEMLLGGRVVTQFKRGAKQYDVIAQMKPSNRATPDAIEEIYLRGGGGLVQLASVVNLQETAAPKALNHYNRQRAVKLDANLAPGIGLGQALDDLDRIAADVLPSGMQTDLAGQSFEFRSSSTKLYFFFVFAVVFIYLVLAAQFESFIDPFTILLSVPLAVFGALLSLNVLGQTLNIYSQIGLIMLIGLVTKNSILIVEYANQLRARGRDIVPAVVEASGIRLRPILMTSFATIFGVLPIALGLGAGGESRQPLGIAVVGGMLFSTFLTLVLVPVMYAIVAPLTKTRRAEISETSAPETGPGYTHEPVLTPAG
ncbi:MAG: efflux RND transporter permease subunit, partial [Rhodothermia bacterium]|nr:efflux RND transporter permease subunit [Rhodothermia bacterium]